jgi:tetratricopeptide (TPR) repeat protein
LEHLESLSPVDPNAMYALARVNMSLGKLTDAEQEMRSYLRVYPQDASAHFGLGSIYLLALKFDRAEQELKQSIAIQPKQSEAYYQLGQTYLDEDKYLESIAQFEKTVDRDSQHGGALTGMGIAYFKLKQYDKAKECLLKSVEAAPDYQLGHYYLGLTLSRLGDAAAAHRELDIATALAAKDAKQMASRLRLNNPDGQP